MGIGICCILYGEDNLNGQRNTSVFCMVKTILMGRGVCCIVYDEFILLVG